MTLAAILAKHAGRVVPTFPAGGDSVGTLEALQNKGVPTVPGVPTPKQVGEAALHTPDAVRARLCALTSDDGVPAALVDALDAADVIACDGLCDETLRAYLRVLEREEQMARGTIPEGWEAVAHCEACGPVYWHGCERLKACAWCKHRKALRAIPRPPVRCSDCRHSVLDPANPAAGTGLCNAPDGHPRWPMSAHRCPHMRPAMDSAAPCAGADLVTTLAN